MKNFLLILPLAILIMASCTDGRMAKELDGKWEQDYVNAYDDGEKDSVIEIVTYKYVGSSANRDGTFTEELEGKTNELDDDDDKYKYTVHWTSSVSGTYKVNAGNLYMTYDLATLEVRLRKKDIHIRPKNMNGVGDLFGRALAYSLMGNLGLYGAGGDPRDEIQEATKKNLYKSLFQSYERASSKENPCMDLYVGKDSMSFEYDGELNEYQRIGGGENTDTTVASNDFADKMEKANWVDFNGGYVKYPSFMKHSEVGHGKDKFDVFTYGDVVLSLGDYSSQVGSWKAAQAFPSKGSLIAPDVTVRDVTYTNRKQAVSSGYTTDGRIYYMGMKIYTEQPGGVMLSLVYPEKVKKAVQPFIDEIAKWGYNPEFQ